MYIVDIVIITAVIIENFAINLTYIYIINISRRKSQAHINDTRLQNVLPTNRQQKYLSTSNIFEKYSVYLIK